VPATVTAVTSAATWRIVAGVKSPDPPPIASTGMASLSAASSRISSASLSAERYRPAAPAKPPWRL